MIATFARADASVHSRHHRQHSIRPCRCDGLLLSIVDGFTRPCWQPADGRCPVFIAEQNMHRASANSAPSQRLPGRQRRGRSWGGEDRQRAVVASLLPAMPGWHVFELARRCGLHALRTRLLQPVKRHGVLAVRRRLVPECHHGRVRHLLSRLLFSPRVSDVQPMPSQHVRRRGRQVMSVVPRRLHVVSWLARARRLHLCGGLGAAARRRRLHLCVPAVRRRHNSRRRCQRVRAVPT
jgi:hypothetical protein